jgi:hypothetical protein
LGAASRFQRLDGALGAPLLDEAEDHGEQHDDGDGDRFEPMAEEAERAVATSRMMMRMFLNWARRIAR